MTIRDREMAARFDNFEVCAETAPARTYEQAKAVRHLIGKTVDHLIREFQRAGVPVNNCDGARNIEVAIYRWLVESNHDNATFPTAEGFGEHSQGPAGERVIANCIRDRDFIEKMRA